MSEKLPGKIIVELRGRPARSAIPDFDALIASARYVTYHGAYDRQRDLADMYQSVHFTWAIDFYEAGQNSAWLLPNRLYEGGSFGAVPLAIAEVETGRWLQRQNAGIVLDGPLGPALLAYFSALSPPSYASAQAALQAVPRECWVDSGADAKRLIGAMIARAPVS